MDRVIRAYPILAGKVSRAREVAKEISGSRSADADEFFRRHGVEHESWHLQETPSGTWLIGVTEIAGPALVAAESYGRSRESFDSWFKDRVREITGIDPDVTPLDPPTECIMCWPARDGRSRP